MEKSILKKELLKYMEKYNLKYISKAVKINKELFEALVIYTKFLNEDCKITERMYNIINDIKKRRLCLNKDCIHPVKFYSFSQGYLKYCSKKCSASSENTISKKKKTYLEKYGLDNPSKVESIKNKKRETSFKKYGDTHYMKTEQGKENFKKTMLEKHGVESPLQKKESLNKYKNTCLERFGKENASLSNNVKNKIKTTLIERYGENPFQNQAIRKKSKKTCEEKYGFDHPMKNEDIKNKVLNNYKENYFIPKLTKILEYLKLELIDDYKSAKEENTWRCLNCKNIFNSSWFGIQQGYSRCLVCNPKLHSNFENEVYDFIKENIKDLEIIRNNRYIIKPKEIDIYIPKLNFAIECHGLYYHSEKFKENKQYHYDKYKQCLDRNIHLIQIFEDEWIFKKEIVKNQILKNILSRNETMKIHARKCVIKEIDAKTKNIFLNKYHIHGSDACKIKLGAFFNEELVALMTFSHGNITKGSKKKEGVYELSRYCVKSQLRINGIANKFLSYFKKNYDFSEIFSYCDLRWFSGDVYKKIGFEEIKLTQPNYWYIDGYNRIHRYKMRKRKDEPKEIPEWVLRQSEGYYRIWDCGHLKFSLIKEDGN